MMCLMLLICLLWNQLKSTQNLKTIILKFNNKSHKNNYYINRNWFGKTWFKDRLVKEQQQHQLHKLTLNKKLSQFLDKNLISTWNSFQFVKSNTEQVICPWSNFWSKRFKAEKIIYKKISKCLSWMMKWRISKMLLLSVWIKWSKNINR